MEPVAQLIRTEKENLNATEVVLSRDAYMRLTLVYRDSIWNNVTLMRPFPLSAPGRCIIFKDATGLPIGGLPDLNDLPAESRAIASEELELLYFTTQIDGIDDVKARHGVITWKFRTNRGAKTVYVKDRNDIRSLAGGRVIFMDTNGMRFEIKDKHNLDERSQTLLEAET
ncbi:MAG: DUF1854 domain-containing protein [Verrucomicrobia bacterium]|nr:DUF1854 domain-containing protein [Verrucomicrobiota bacterium]MCG2681798.1 DUF1854 domain-containing protein [Kiritimatiellia bacterium]MBU4247279.1 DUF1854 domain-containing protein [Verrucomicrobiota bacterium]MBU4289895.1 DUF1854 domain-containing protein [Verrucomicrobiota bacterium]MBU4427961.1 DUF1854 domain-containing protein [Verrucomicrobiota bacterium]